MKRKLNDERPSGAAQVRAQRKFAQGVRLSNSSTHTHGKRSPAFSTPSPPPVSSKPKTEDFINFLCYRGTSALPTCLTFFNYGGLKTDELKSRRINEQEAKFAMTALKLKYQQKKLSIVSTLARKVKERRVILTRSRGRNPDENMVLISKRNNSNEYHGRNAPSPDIIDGVRPAECKPPEHFKHNKKNKSSPEPEPRLAKTEKAPTERRPAKPKFLPSRVSTRAFSKKNDSPLQELPMVKKPILKPAKEPEKSKVYSRPTRKTKETATIYLGLLNKNFSSDEDEDEDLPNMNHQAKEDSSSNSSSSESKFLEKQYHASLKRDETSRMQKVVPKNRQKTTKPKKKPVKKIKPEKRVLRSHIASNGKSCEKPQAVPETRTFDRRQPGAARKSVAALRSKVLSSSSSDSSESEKEDSDDSSSSKADSTEEEVKADSAADESKEDSSGEDVKDESIAASNDEEEPSESESDKEENETEVVEAVENVDQKTEEIGTESHAPKLDEMNSDGEGDMSKDVIVEKVSIAIQVDMDLDEEAEAAEVPNGHNIHSENVGMFMQPHQHQHHQQHQEQPIHHIPRPMISEMPPPPTSIINNIVHCSVPSSMEQPPTVLSFNSMTSFSPYAISHPMMPFGCMTESSGSSLSSFDTHIRTVAANLDIRLVRPTMAPSGLSPFPFSTNSFARPVLMPDNPFFQPFRMPSYTTYRPLTPLVTQYHSMQQQSSTVHAPMGPRLVHSQGQDLSLIQNLPNVSIVPRFDRNSKVVILPNRKSTPQAASTSEKPPSASVDTDQQKKKGRGRQQPAGLPAPSSPLTVRKDSSTPATYSGSGTKRNTPSSSRENKPR